jgi:hypothetical protein
MTTFADKIVTHSVIGVSKSLPFFIPLTVNLNVPGSWLH